MIVPLVGVDFPIVFVGIALENVAIAIRHSPRKELLVDLDAILSST